MVETDLRNPSVVKALLPLTNRGRRSADTDFSVRSLSEENCGRSKESKVWHTLLMPMMMVRRVTVCPAGSVLDQIMPLDRCSMFVL